MMNEPTSFAPPPLQIREKQVKPYVSYTILGFTIFVFAVQMLTQYLYQVDLPAMFGMKINDAIKAGEYWRLITPAFLHGNLIHIFFNMYAVVVLGMDLEKRFGNFRYALLYFAGAYGGNVLSFVLSNNNSLGASTSIFGLLGAELVFFYQNRKIFGQNARKAIQQVITIAAINFLFGLQGGIDNWGHLGGFLGGLLFTGIGGPILSFEGSYPVLDVIDERPVQQVIAAFLMVIFVFSILVFMNLH